MWFLKGTCPNTLRSMNVNRILKLHAQHDGNQNGSFLHFLENSKDGRIDVFQNTIWLLKELVKWTNKQLG